MNDIILNSKNKTYLFIQTNNNQYMIDSEYVKKIIFIQNLERPNVLPKHVIGLLEYEDEFINVLDLKSLLGLDVTPYPLNSKIIIMDYNGLKFALIAENVSDIKRIKASLIKDAPYNNSEIIQQIYSPKNELSTTIISLSSIYSILKKSLDEEIFVENRANILPENENALVVLKERSLNTKQKEEDKNYLPISSDNQYTTFKIDRAVYCIKNTHIKEFFKLNKTKITPVPSTPDFIKGILNIKGDFICVLDIQKYFNRGEVLIGDKSNVIVLTSDKAKIGILTNGISKNITLNDNVGETLNDYTDIVQDDEVYCVLNIENILNNEKLYVK